MSTLPPMNLDPMMLAAYVARAMSKSHRIAFAQLSPEFKILLHSSNFPAIIEKDVEEIVGVPIMDLLREFVGIESFLKEVLEGRQPLFHIEYVNRISSDALVTYFDFKVMPLDETQPRLGLLVLIEDVTDNGRLQQSLTQDRNELLLVRQKLSTANSDLQSLSRLKSLFLSMAAHDLRAPLSVIAGYTGLIQHLIEHDDKEKASYFLEIINAQTKRINQLIVDMLDLDTIDRGELALQLETCDLLKIVDEITQTLPISYQNRNITLLQEMPDKPISMLLDRDKIYRVFYNLVSNAFKYTPPDGEVKVKIVPEETQVLIHVSDNGYGMSQDEVEQLFQLYYRTEEAKESNIGGTGLGLYIVKMLVEAHEGQVVATSQPNKGTTFTIYLPFLKEKIEQYGKKSA